MKVWVDCTAAAHPLVLRPIIDGLGSRGHEVTVTARAYGQTEGVLELLGIPYRSFGRHADAGTARKGLAVAARSAALLAWSGGARPELALAHGSVDLAVVAALRRIPSVQMQDYEFAGIQRKLAWRTARRVMVPDAIPVERLIAAGASEDKLVRYPGLKEDYYLAGFEADPSALTSTGLESFGIGPDRSHDDRILAVVRPPPETSAYHADNPLYGAVLDRLLADARTVTILIPRTPGQGDEARARGSERLIVPVAAVDAQSLIAYADLVVSAGGTMNREAVALGTPVYTIFSGRMGAVDERLIAEGRLRRLVDAAEVVLERRATPPGPVEPRDPAPLVDAVLAAADPPGG